MIQWMDESSGKVVGFVALETLSDDDYADYFIPLLEEAIDEYGDVRLMLKFEHFEGWKAHAAWDDLRNWPGLKNIERIAVVSENTMEDLMAWVAKIIESIPDTEVRYFKEAQIVDAWDWLGENPEELYRGRKATLIPR
jgi:hypothetical protein